MMNSVLVYYKTMLAGTLEKTAVGQFIFLYDEMYLSSDRPSISHTLPKSTKRFESSDLFAFFDGLIPEGWLLNLATTELRLNPLSDCFELLTKLCRDTIGAVHVGEKMLVDLKSQRSSQSKTSFENFGRCLICYENSDSIYHDKCMLGVFGKKIEPLVDIDEEVLELLAKRQLNQKLALGGSQKKLSLDLTDLSGRFIFKLRGLPPHLPENEHLCLKLAESIGVKVEKSALIPTSMGKLGFIARRFDRGDALEEFHQEDFCQILNKPAYKKYNAGLEQVGKVLKTISDYPGDNLYRLYELALFNFIIGNVDAHLKNFSLTYEDYRSQKKLLSPAYDLLSTDLFIQGDNEESALAINGKKNKLTADDFFVLAKSFGITKKVHHKLIEKFKRHLETWDAIINMSFLESEKKNEFKMLIRKKVF